MISILLSETEDFCILTPLEDKIYKNSNEKGLPHL